MAGTGPTPLKDARARLAKEKVPLRRGIDGSPPVVANQALYALVSQPQEAIGMRAAIAKIHFVIDNDSYSP